MRCSNMIYKLDSMEPGGLPIEENVINGAMYLRVCGAVWLFLEDAPIGWVAAILETNRLGSYSDITLMVWCNDGF